jgi:hypothetical protein
MKTMLDIWHAVEDLHEASDGMDTLLNTLLVLTAPKHFTFSNTMGECEQFTIEAMALLEARLYAPSK